MIDADGAVTQYACPRRGGLVLRRCVGRLGAVEVGAEVGLGPVDRVALAGGDVPEAGGDPDQEVASATCPG